MTAVAVVEVGYGGPERLFGVTGLGVHGAVAHGAMRLAPPAPGAADGPAEGALGVLVDDVLGYAAVAVAPPGHWSVSTDIAIDLTGGWWDATGLFTAQARAVHADPRASLAVCHVIDEAGTPIAHATQRGRYLPLREGGIEPDEGEPDAASAGAGAVDDALGLARDGSDLVLPGSPLVLNRQKSLHGGISLYVSQRAARAELDRAGLTGLAPTSIRITYPRPFTGRRDVRYRAVLRHRGRSFAVLDVTGTEAGRTGTLAQVTAHPAG